MTSGLLASDQSAVELVPLLQAEVAKLRQLLQKQQEESSAKKSVLEKEGQTQVMLEMKMRVRDLEQQLEERELLIRSLEPKNDDELNASKTTLTSFFRRTAGVGPPNPHCVTPFPPSWRVSVAR